MSPVVQMLFRALDWYLAHRNAFELLGLLLAVMGTLFAVLSIRDGQKMTRDLRAVFDHLTTKECGSFPSYMQEVERLIGEARDSIYIATDFPAHGVWTDRGRYGGYVKALENRKAERVRRGHALDIQILTLDAESRERALETRFPETRWKDYVKKGGFTRSRRMYEELENTQVPDARAGFLAEMAERQTRAFDADLRFAQRWQHRGLMPVYLWIVDGEKAVFAIPSFGDQQTEYGFVTEEQGLVQALLSVWSRYVERADRVASGPSLVKAS
ncbi:MAG: hypothetical protein E6J61_20610 [Deltaproteobacteria bacterium]|nr:MAG: hypothetical protein E6J61_20610 [Deltaproteobacteria bacterium]